MRVGIISSQRRPPDAFDWMRYHVDVGIDAFYIIFEDTPDVPDQLHMHAAALTREKGRAITLYTETRAVDRTKEDNYTDLMTRQANWVDRMVAKAHADGVEWVFHIDDDEVLYPGSHNARSTWPQILQAVPPSCSSLHLQNWEAFSPSQVKSSWLTDDGVRFLPQKCAHLFSAYTNGKSGSRTVPGQRSKGPHHFQGGMECELKPEQGVLAHFEALAMTPNDLPPQRWVEKNLLRVNDDKSRIPFESVHASIAAVASGDADVMHKTWVKYRSVDGDRFKACPMPMDLQLPSRDYNKPRDVV